jgi:hypothetical protein
MKSEEIGLLQFAAGSTAEARATSAEIMRR